MNRQKQVTRQKLVTQWAHPFLLKHVQAVCQADPELRASVNHLSGYEILHILVHTANLKITDLAQGHCSSCEQFVLDVQTVAMADGNGVWGKMEFCCPST